VRMPMKQKPSADDVRRVALAALAAALEDRKEEAKKKPGLTGVRAVATGAVIYTAGRAAFTGRRFVRDHFGSDGQVDEGDDEADEEYEDEEPRAEEEEEYEDEEDAEPRAEEEEEYEDEEDVEPRAEEDDDYEESEPEEEQAPPSRRPPSHAKRGADEVPDIELPSRPSRSRAPVGRT
jgi:hypothetical protein